MPEVVIGARTIPYELHRSPRAVRKRIEVTPGRVRVIVPAGAEAGDVERFVRSRRRWLHDKTEEVREEAERLRARTTSEGYHSGAKVLFRGRHLKLRVEPAPVERPTLTYRSAFHVQVPTSFTPSERETTARELLARWLDHRLAADAREIIRRRAHPHGLHPRAVQIKDQRTLWGSCGRDQVIRLDRKLTRVPKPVFEYVLVHELCHLRHRDHSPAFWELIREVLPDYEERKEWLEAHEVEVG